MDFLTDTILAMAALGAAVFCIVLSRRLRALSSLDSGMGSAIAVLSAQVDDLTRALKSAQDTARKTAEQLESQSRRAEAAARQLELLLASMHDLPAPETRPPSSGAESGDPQRPLSRWQPALRPAGPASGRRGERVAEGAAIEPGTGRTRVLRRQRAGEP